MIHALPAPPRREPEAFASHPLRLVIRDLREIPGMEPPPRVQVHDVPRAEHKDRMLAAFRRSLATQGASLTPQGDGAYAVNSQPDTR